MRRGEGGGALCGWGGREREREKGLLLPGLGAFLCVSVCDYALTVYLYVCAVTCTKVVCMLCLRLCTKCVCGGRGFQSKKR
jgi:hypothetical protein